MTVETFTARDSVRLAYRDFGPRDGIPVVLCHGLGANSAQFLDDAAYFADLGYRVILPDIRGHGASEAPKAYPLERFSIEVMTEDMLTLLDHAGVGPVHWVGNSLGGIIAFQMVANAPKRFSSLVTFGTAHRLNLPGFAANAIPVLFRMFGSGLTAWSTALGSTSNRAALPLVETMIASHDPEVGRAIASHVRAYDLSDEALSYAGPMLLIRGGRDTAVNQALSKTLSRFTGRPNFTLVDLPKGGHMANLDATDAWRAALLTFWRQIDAQA